MPERQMQAIGQALADIYGEKNEGGLLCCTLEAVNADGMDVSIQVMAETINLAPYPFAEDPLTRLELSGAVETLEHVALDLVDWDANAFATVGTSGNDPIDIARLIDRTFVKVLRCAPDYTLKASTEDLA
ncbi:hypothetical protein [uncultured Reyranella sp.]|uniref:hypothetical protein n=1 Tax=uncultured Reyranella sp. TaxID=735512 RepID=UPI00259CCAD1|nr:hypothetical protein [uncultured Reyranella sp.]